MRVVDEYSFQPCSGQPSGNVSTLNSLAIMLKIVKTCMHVSRRRTSMPERMYSPGPLLSGDMHKPQVARNFLRHCLPVKLLPWLCQLSKPESHKARRLCES